MRTGLFRLRGFRAHGLLRGLLVGAALYVGCSSTPAPGPSLQEPLDAASRSPGSSVSEPVVLPRPDAFSGPLAQSHEQALAAIGPRLPESKADAAARSYLTREFLAAGARVWEVRDGGMRHLLAEIEGDSPDLFMLVAPYSLVDPDDWIGDSGAALLVELARNLGRTRPTYTIRFALAETRAADPGRGAPKIETPGAARDRVVAAGTSLARALAAAEFESRSVLRGVIAFDAPGRPDLRFARDLRSHPIYREIFWSTARRLGFTSLFPEDAEWSMPKSLQLGLEAAADGKVLALVDESWTRPEWVVEPTGARSVATLEQSGRVTLDALDQLMHRFARIDGFGELPQAARGPGATSPQAVPTSPESPPSI